MAIKYVRDKQCGEIGAPDRYAPPAMFGSLRRINPKRRVLLLYIGMGAVLLALSVVNVRDRFDGFEHGSVLRGVGVVAAKEEGGVLVLEVGGVRARTETDAETWDRLHEGDRIAVLYQRSRGGRALRIVEAGVVALPKTGES